ncbi:hypothetical protein SCORR_v1c05750 [Spiroplasma corruscae]|uniref:UvrD-like helicase C-terminal domain-containing protein n=1 Tax=Spiroplasma corruscae TaxID=216934 RepID=A0A222EPC4_9MOLU|nr:3'-5' exonuclease [Spiroplasma corruscae]ASP28347.1 hypothetical protein SCORR_v1c05750 [Spiroplasma corruscae]
MKLSDEQINIIENIINNNIIVEAVAGSGKTTTALEMAKRYPDKEFLLVTYNAGLKEDTRKKVKNNNLYNITVENYHSLTINYYGIKNGKDDSAILKVLDEKITLQNFKIPDVIILDEVQDMTIHYYKLIVKLVKDFNNKNISLCVLGDRKQTLYQFNGSDFRYLEKADQIFLINDKPWLRLKLSLSFRVPNKVCDFINKVFYKYDFIYSTKTTDVEIDYIIYDPYNLNNVSKSIINEIEKYGIENTFLLSNTTKTSNTSNPLNNILNLINQNYAIYVKENLIRKDKSLKKNKIEITTMNSTKGREKDLVIIYGFDDFYFKGYAKNENNLLPCDKFYVAITRAKQKVILLQSEWSAPLCFLDIKKITSTTNVIGNKSHLYKACELVKEFKSNDRWFDVTDLTEYIDASVFYNFIKLLNIEIFEFTNNNQVDFSQTPFNKTVEYKEKIIKEDVSAFNGSLITYIQLYNKGNFNDEILSWINKIIEMRKAQDINFHLNKEVDRINEILSKKTLSITELTEIACVIDTVQSGRNYKYLQLKQTNFEWLSDKFFDDSIKLIEEIDPNNNIYFEKQLYIDNNNNDILIKVANELNIIELRIDGRCDGYNEKEKTLWEFKLTKDIDDIMYFQTIMYAYMLKNSGKEVKHIYLFDIYKLEIRELKIDFNKFEHILYDLLKYKCIQDSIKTDEQFFKELNIYEET